VHRSSLVQWRSIAPATTTAAATAAVPTTAAATAARTTTAAASAGLILRLIDAQRTTAHILAIEALDCARRIGLVHLDETETARTAAIAVDRQGNELDSAEF
jgi:hypothetical protein